MKPHKAAPILGIVILSLAAFWYYSSQSGSENGPLTASGSIEARNVRIASEVSGRVTDVFFEEGERVNAGDTMVQLDTTLLTSQLAQAEAALESARAGSTAALSAVEAARATAKAAQASYALAEAGPSAEQLAVAQTGIDKARISVDALQEAYDELSEAAKETRQAKDLRQQLDLAISSLDTAKAQYTLVSLSTRPEQLDVFAAQLQAAEAQVEAAQAQAQGAAGQVAAAQAVVDTLHIQISRLSIKAPIDGVVLSRSIEPGEFVTPGSVLIVIGDLDRLMLTVYVPEDRYGSLHIGDPARVSVDSHPGESFLANVVHIADKAEFTPRNVQTDEGRRTTVFAVKLAVKNERQDLKPGMMTDVVFGTEQ
jgi:HlyD family secretion protein